MSDLRVEPARVQQTAASDNHSSPAASTAGSALSSAAAVEGSGGGTASSVRPIPPITPATATTASQPELNPELTNSPGGNRTTSIRIKGSGKRARADPLYLGPRRRFRSPTRYYRTNDDKPRRLFRMDHVLREDARIDPERTGLNQKDELMKRKLQEGYSVISRELGEPSDSGDWIVHRNDICRFEPVENSSVEIKEGDIVFCEIDHPIWTNLERRLERKFALQKVLHVYEEMNIRYFDIGYRGRYRNGWCQGQDIYGRLCEVLFE